MATNGTLTALQTAASLSLLKNKGMGPNEDLVTAINDYNKATEITASSISGSSIDPQVTIITEVNDLLTMGSIAGNIKVFFSNFRIRRL